MINRVLTWGLDRRWRLACARECLSLNPKRILDLACGTGDLAIQLAGLAEGDVEITGLDYSEPMLEIARKRAESLVPRKKLSFLFGDASALPFPDGYFDCVGISFAFRNLTYKNPSSMRYLAEVLRVLRHGGRFVIVETSQPDAKPIRGLYHLYMRWFAFPVGRLLSGNRAAYYYLAQSASRYYTAVEVSEILLQTGFSQVSFSHLLWGGVAIHVAIK